VRSRRSRLFAKSSLSSGNFLRFDSEERPRVIEFLSRKLRIGIVRRILDRKILVIADVRAIKFVLNGSIVSSAPTWQRTLSACSGSPPPSGVPTNFQLHEIAVFDRAALYGSKRRARSARLFQRLGDISSVISIAGSFRCSSWPWLHFFPSSIPEELQTLRGISLPALRCNPACPLEAAENGVNFLFPQRPFPLFLERASATLRLDLFPRSAFFDQSDRSFYRTKARARAPRGQFPSLLFALLSTLPPREFPNSSFRAACCFCHAAILFFLFFA